MRSPNSRNCVNRRKTSNSGPPGHLFVLSAPSGTGKTTVVQRLCASVPRLQFSITHTTRTPRPGEQHGTSYFFVAEPTFRQMIAAHAFLEWAEVHGNLYGTAAAPIRAWRQAGEDVLLDVDVQGARAVKVYDPRATLIFLLPPSLEVLAERLRGRGTEDEATLQRRLRQAQVEMAARDAYHYVLTNEDVAATTEAIAQIILRHRTPRV